MSINKPEKGSDPRIITISTKLLSMMNNLDKNKTRIFPITSKMARNNISKLRKTLARKLNNPRFHKIHLHTLRHYKATMEYHKTKDILHVQYILGHRNILNTMIYINIERAVFTQTDNTYTCKTAKTIEEATQLIENGFEYITEMDGLKIFRKRK